MISISKGANPNYLCKIIKIENMRKVAGADRLMVFNVDGNEIITSIQTVEGTIGVYFPLECQINADYLRQTNSFSDVTLNDDQTQKGYFSSTGRVRATKLKEQKSMGYVAPIATLEKLIGPKYINLTNYVGQEFDMIGDIQLAKKYVVRNTPGSGAGTPKGQKAVKISKLIDNQFRLHYDTAQLAKNLHKLTPESIISITNKLHGTSFVSSKVLCKRQLTWKDKIAKFFGIPVSESYYDNVYSSRKVIKNGFINANPQHYYKTDVWKDANDLLKDNLLNGESVYGEIVGFTKDGAQIQDGYDYGCAAKSFKVYIYRVTHTNTDGKVYELPANLVAERAIQLGVNPMPEFFYGKAKYFVSDEEFTDDRDWKEAIYELLKVRYVNDSNCTLCKKKVPAEGIVLRVEGMNPEAFKFKSFAFLQRESKQLDKETVNIEDQTDEESITE